MSRPLHVQLRAVADKDWTLDADADPTANLASIERLQAGQLLGRHVVDGAVLCALVEKHVETLVAELPEGDPLTSRLRQYDADGISADREQLILHCDLLKVRAA